MELKTSTGEVLNASGINKSFAVGDNTLDVLRRIELSISSCEMVALMGPSGSGKSTLLNILGGLLAADAGRVLLDGYEYGTTNPLHLTGLRRNRIGWVFQSPNLLDHLSVCDNVVLPLTLSGVPLNEARDRAVRALGRVELSDKLEFLPQELSGGQKQRASIARAISGDRQLLLADEPTGHLDSENGLSLIQLFQGLCHDPAKPLSMLMVTHDPVLASEADRMLLLREGRVIPTDS